MFPWINKPIRGTQLNRSHPLAQGLVSCWVMNEGGGSKIFDSIYNNTGTLISPDIFWSADAIHFTASLDTYIDCGSPTNLDVTTGLTVISKVYKDSANNDRIIVSKANSASVAPYRQFSFGVSSSGELILYGDVSGFTEIVSADTSFTNNEDVVCAATYDGVTGKLYEHGIEVGSNAISGAIGSHPTWDLRIGGLAYTDSSFGHWDGNIYFVYIYNRALVASEIQALNANPYQIFEPIFIPSYMASAGSTILQPGDKYQVVWNGSEFVITYTDDTALASADVIRIGLDPTSGATAVLTGTVITDSPTETEIKDGGETIIITLTNDTFVTGTTSEDAIAAGISGSASWNSEVRDNTDNTDIVLSVGDTVATVTLPAASGYDISTDDTITVTIPAASLTAAAEVVATPTFDVTNESAGGSIVVLRRRLMEVA